MKKLYFLLVSLLVSTLTFSQTSDLYFSMYGEGSSSNKWLEIYNGTGASVDLSNYSVELYANGSATATGTQALSGNLSDGDVYVIYNSSAAPAIANSGDLASTVTFFNGDDAVALLKTGTVIDVIGQIGSDPGSAWTVGTSGSTSNRTLVRKSDICDPNPVGLDSFGSDDATSEWTSYAIDTEWGQIGSHFACSSAPNLTITSPSDNAVFTAGTANVSISINVQNFNVANGSGDGHIRWTVNGGGAMMKYDTTDASVSVSDGQSYTVFMELVNNSNTPIAPAVNATVNFSVSNPCANSPGDIIITEIMQNPSAVSDGNGEWFELYNTTGSPIDINGWELSDSGSNFHAISSSLIVPANGFVVLGNNADSGTNGGITVNYEYSSYTLGNGADSIILTCSGSIIDQVAWDGGTEFPDPAGASMELNAGLFNSTDNDNGSSWGTSTSEINPGGDKGTPGSLNTLSTNKEQINGFNLYPNPASKGYVNISSNNNATMAVNVFDVLGKQVLSQEVRNNRLDVTSLTPGIYILRATQDNAITTRKLVIK